MIYKIAVSLATLSLYQVLGMEKMAKKISKARVKNGAFKYGSIALAVVVGVVGAGYVFKNFNDPWGIIANARDGFQGVI